MKLKKNSINKFIWILLFIIFCCQLFVIIKSHSIIGHLTIWDTIFLLIIRLDVSPFIGKWLREQESRVKVIFFIKNFFYFLISLAPIFIYYWMYCSDSITFCCIYSRIKSNTL